MIPRGLPAFCGPYGDAFPFPLIDVPPWDGVTYAGDGVRLASASPDVITPCTGPGTLYPVGFESVNRACMWLFRVRTARMHGDITTTYQPTKDDDPEVTHYGPFDLPMTRRASIPDTSSPTEPPVDAITAEGDLIRGAANLTIGVPPYSFLANTGYFPTGERGILVLIGPIMVRGKVDGKFYPYLQVQHLGFSGGQGIANSWRSEGTDTSAFGVVFDGMTVPVYETVLELEDGPRHPYRTEGIAVVETGNYPQDNYYAWKDRWDPKTGDYIPDE